MSGTTSKELDKWEFYITLLVKYLSFFGLYQKLMFSKEGKSKSMTLNILKDFYQIHDNCKTNFKKLYTKYKNHCMKIYREPMHKLENTTKFDDTVSQQDTSVTAEEQKDKLVTPVLAW